MKRLSLCFFVMYEQNQAYNQDGYKASNHCVPISKN